MTDNLLLILPVVVFVPFNFQPLVIDGEYMFKQQNSKLLVAWMSGLLQLIFMSFEYEVMLSEDTVMSRMSLYISL